MNNEKKVNPLQETIKTLQEALNDWDKIPDDAECEMDAFKRKTREILKRLNDQMKDLNF